MLYLVEGLKGTEPMTRNELQPHRRRSDMNDSTLTSWADNEWPAYTPDEILPGLFQGGTEDHEVVGYPAPRHHYERM